MPEQNIDLGKINKTITDRVNVFYWQTDRAVDLEQAGHIWADRHHYFQDQQLIEDVNRVLGSDKLTENESLQSLIALKNG